MRSLRSAPKAVEPKWTQLAPYRSANQPPHPSKTNPNHGGALHLHRRCQAFKSPTSHHHFNDLDDFFEVRPGLSPLRSRILAAGCRCFVSGFE
jgi:hypothetical protein